MAALATEAPGTVTKGRRQNGSSSSSQSAGRHFQNQKMKVDQIKKVEFFRTGDKLKNQLMNIEKDKNILLFNKKSDFRMEYCTLEELEHKLAKNRKEEKAKIQQKLAKIHNSVKGLQRQLKDVKPTPEFVDKLREMMEEAEMAINAFKEEQRQIYEELMREEKSATNELNAMERKMEQWALGTSTTRQIFKQGLLPLEKDLQSHLPEEVLDLERFLQQTGGRQGGWDEYDHQTFLKIFVKHKGKSSYIDEALDCLPDRTKEDIQQHEKWYQEFQILEARKKESIQNWKMKKKEEREKILAQKEKPEEVLTAGQLQHEEDLKQKAEEERKKRLAELEAWKRQKAIAYAVKQATQLQEEEEKEKKKQRERQRQFEIKLLLENYSRQKRAQEELLRLEKENKEQVEREERKKTAAEEILKFQERDLHKLKRKIQEKQAKEDEKAEKEKRLSKLREKVELNVTRDPYRLYRPTKVWEERIKEIGPEGSGPLLHIPHRFKMKRKRKESSCSEAENKDLHHHKRPKHEENSENSQTFSVEGTRNTKLRSLNTTTEDATLLNKSVDDLADLFRQLKITNKIRVEKREPYETKNYFRKRKRGDEIEVCLQRSDNQPEDGKNKEYGQDKSPPKKKKNTEEKGILALTQEKKEEKQKNKANGEKQKAKDNEPQGPVHIPAGREHIPDMEEEEEHSDEELQEYAKDNEPQGPVHIPAGREHIPEPQGPVHILARREHIPDMEEEEEYSNSDEELWEYFNELYGTEEDEEQQSSCLLRIRDHIWECLKGCSNKLWQGILRLRKKGARKLRRLYKMARKKWAEKRGSRDPRVPHGHGPTQTVSQPSQTYRHPLPPYKIPLIRPGVQVDWQAYRWERVLCWVRDNPYNQAFEVRQNGDQQPHWEPEYSCSTLTPKTHRTSSQKSSTAATETTGSTGTTMTGHED